MLDELVGAEADRRRAEVAALDRLARQDRGGVGGEVEAGIDAAGQRHLEREVVDLAQAGDLLGGALLSC